MLSYHDWVRVVRHKTDKVHAEYPTAHLSPKLLRIEEVFSSFGLETNTTVLMRIWNHLVIRTGETHISVSSGFCMGIGGTCWLSQLPGWVDGFIVFVAPQFLWHCSSTCTMGFMGLVKLMKSSVVHCTRCSTCNNQCSFQKPSFKNTCSSDSSTYLVLKRCLNCSVLNSASFNWLFHYLLFFKSSEPWWISTKSYSIYYADDHIVVPWRPSVLYILVPLCSV